MKLKRFLGFLNIFHSSSIYDTYPDLDLKMMNIIFIKKIR